MGREYRLGAAGLAELFEYCEYAIAYHGVVVKGVCLGHNHIAEVAAERVAPQVSGILRTLGIGCDAVPVVRHLHPEIP